MDAVSEIWDILSIYLSADTRKIATLKLSNLDWRTASLDQVKDLVRRGANVNAKNRFGETPLHRASNGGAGVENVKYLVEQGADVNAKDGFGATPLHGAFSAGVAKYLIMHGADVHAKDNNGATPLHQACMHSIHSVKCLVEQGADINAKDKEGNTPLHMAAKWGRKEVVEYLVEQGADIRAKNKEGKIPFGLAAANHHTELVQYLDEHLAKEGLAKLEEQSKTSPLKTTLKGMEEKGEPVSTPTMSPKGASYALSEEYTRGNDVSISIVNPALTKNKGR